MNNFRILFYGLLSFLLVACQKEVKKEVKSVTLRSEQLKVDTTVIGTVFEFVTDSLIFIRANSNYPYDICCVRGDSLCKVAQFGDKGEGPYEFEGGAIAFVSPSNRRLYGHNVNYSKIYAVPFPLLSSVQDPSTWTKFAFFGVDEVYLSRQLRPICAIGDSTFIVVGGARDTRNVFSLLHVNDSVAPVEGFDFPDPDADIPLNIKRGVYVNSDLQKRPSGNRFAWTGFEGDYLCLFDYENGRIEHVRYVKDTWPIYAISKNFPLNPSFDRNNYPGHRIYVTDQYIYCSVSPFATSQECWDSKDYKGFVNYSRDCIEVYDWEGNLVRTCMLDTPISTFTVSPDDRYIYASAEDLGKEDMLYLRFKLEL